MIEILKKIPFFANLPEDDLSLIAEKVEMQYFPANYVIFNQGDIGDTMYIIKRGEVQVIRENNILATLSDGQFFGEMALVSDEIRNAKILTTTDIELLAIKKDDFTDILSNNPSIASLVSYEVVKRSNTIY